MSQLEWEQVKEIFYQALSSPPASRSEFLDSACGGDPSVRSQVEVLLDSYDSDFLESPLLGGEKAQSTPLFEPGKSFSHYTILKLLGRGGMGEVYLANDTGLDRLTAIKVIHSDSGFGEQAAGRLIREARAAAKLDHPNICSVYEVGDFEGQPYIAMQYIEGDMLDSVIAKGEVTFDQSITYTRQLAAALGKAHSWGIVHRDIKPSNIIIDTNGQVKVLDFGLAKQTVFDSENVDVSAVGMIAGTVTYMSPEHIRGHEINGQSDIWSIGVVLYQMLTGRLPFKGETKADLIAAILNNEYEPASTYAENLPSSVEYIIERALQKDRSTRYVNVEELDADLAELVDKGTVQRRWGKIVEEARIAPATASASFWRFALPVVLVLALAAGGTGIWRYSGVSTQRQSFSSGSIGGLKITNLYSIKRQGAIAILDPHFSPDGRSISYSLSGSDGSSIFIQQVSSSAPFRLTAGEHLDYSPVWSPDSQRIAYVSQRDETKAIWAIPAGGGDPVHLVDLPAAQDEYTLRKWRNDGKAIYLEYARGPKEIDLETGAITDVDIAGVMGKVRPGYAISPDESRILLTTAENGREQLWVKSMNKPDAVRLDEPSPRSSVPYWFPDNERYAYSSDVNGSAQIYVRDIASMAAQQVTFGHVNATQPVVSPDGQQIVYISNFDEANLFLTDITTLEEKPVTNNVNLQIFPSFSADGSSVAYQTIADSTKLMLGTLRVKSLASDQFVTLENQGCCIEQIPGREEISYARQLGTETNIWKSAPNGTSTQISTVGVLPPILTVSPLEFDSNIYSWSPDGSQVTFISRRSGQDNVWTVGLDGSNEKMVSDLRDGTTKAASPIWSPQGDRIAYLEAIGKDVSSLSEHLRVAVYEKGNVSVAAEFQSKSVLLGWSLAGDGVYVGVAAGNDYDIHFVACDGSETVKKLTTLTNARRFGLNISPDRQWIEYIEQRNDIDNVVIAPLTGGEPRPVTSNTDPTIFYSGVTWSPDSKSLLYSKQTGGMQISLISHN